MIMDFKKKLVGAWKRILIVVGVLLVIAGLIAWHYYDPEAAKFVAYLTGGGLLLWQVWASSQRAKAADETAKAVQQTANSTEKGNIAERFKNAIEHLGHESPSVRLGGIYALHHIAQDEKEYRERIFEILCAHIRETTAPDGYEPKTTPIVGKDSGVLSQPTIEIQSILKLLFSKLPGDRPYKGFYANLDYANLMRAYLFMSNIQSASFISANLQDAHFSNSDLQRANFFNANLRGAVFHGATLKGTHFWNTDIQNADFTGANLQEATLSSAKNLTAKRLLEAKTLYKAILPDEIEAEIRQRKPELLDKPKPDNELES